jgi:Na+-transporting methylmalonyl-CoA/oxaloacetate decarboxylase gamma subunit
MLFFLILLFTAVIGGFRARRLRREREEEERAEAARPSERRSR